MSYLLHWIIAIHNCSSLGLPHRSALKFFNCFTLYAVASGHLLPYILFCWNNKIVELNMYWYFSVCFKSHRKGICILSIISFVLSLMKVYFDDHLEISCFEGLVLFHLFHSQNLLFQSFIVWIPYTTYTNYSDRILSFFRLATYLLKIWFLENLLFQQSASTFFSFWSFFWN